MNSRRWKLTAKHRICRRHCRLTFGFYDCGDRPISENSVTGVCANFVPGSDWSNAALPETTSAIHAIEGQNQSIVRFGSVAVAEHFPIARAAPARETTGRCNGRKKIANIKLIGSDTESDAVVPMNSIGVRAAVV